MDKRTWVYILSPFTFNIPGHECGNNKPTWSEFKDYLWCEKCQEDFVPEYWGILDGPVPVNICEMMGIYFDTVDLETGEIKPGPSGIVHFKKNVV